MNDRDVDTGFRRGDVVGGVCQLRGARDSLI